MKMGMKEVIVGSILFGAYYFAPGSSQENSQNSTSLKETTERIVKTIDHYHYKVSHKEESPEQMAAQWERQNQSSCREVSSAFNRWKDSPDKEDIFQVIELVGFHSTMIQ